MCPICYISGFIAALFGGSFIAVVNHPISWIISLILISYAVYKFYEAKQRGKNMSQETKDRNKKTGNIKRITFGARGMTTGLRNPKRSRSFAARHRCAQKTDKLAPGYWACRIGRYPAVSGAPYRTWW